MPPLVALAGALGSAALVRWTVRTIVRVQDEIEAARQRRIVEEGSSADLPTLRRDPVSGSYRIR
jgi:hypothetical protein